MKTLNDLTLIRQNGGVYIDSREVAEIIGKRHSDLLRDIGRYGEYMEKSIERNFAFNDFFLESSYYDSIGRELPCYLLSKMGCAMVANKLTGEKGVLFTAAYVTKFEQMEQRERVELEALIEMSHRPEPRLGEVNACARLIVCGMKNLGASPGQVMEFLRETYEPLGFRFEFEPDDMTAPCWHNANGIAKLCGMYSLYGKPHGQAVACILNEILCIGDEHKRMEMDYYGYQVGFSTLYDDDALIAVMQWLVDNHLPDDVCGFERTYHVQYIDI